MHASRNSHLRSVEVKRVWNSIGLINYCKQAKRGNYGSIFFEEEKRSNRDGGRTTENGRGSEKGRDSEKGRRDS